MSYCHGEDKIGPSTDSASRPHSPGRPAEIQPFKALRVGLTLRSCETASSIFHISQMPPSGCVASEARCPPIRALPVTFCLWVGSGEGLVDGWPADVCDLVFVQTGAARAGLRCNNGKPTFKKNKMKKTALVLKMLLLVLVLLFYDVVIN